MFHHAYKMYCLCSRCGKKKSKKSKEIKQMPEFLYRFNVLILTYWYLCKPGTFFFLPSPHVCLSFTRSHRLSHCLTLSLLVSRSATCVWHLPLLLCRACRCHQKHTLQSDWVSRCGIKRTDSFVGWERSALGVNQKRKDQFTHWEFSMNGGTCLVWGVRQTEPVCRIYVFVLCVTKMNILYCKLFRLMFSYIVSI